MITNIQYLYWKGLYIRSFSSLINLKNNAEIVDEIIKEYDVLKLHKKAKEFIKIFLVLVAKTTFPYKTLPFYRKIQETMKEVKILFIPELTMIILDFVS